MEKSIAINARNCDDQLEDHDGLDRLIAIYTLPSVIEAQYKHLKKTVEKPGSHLADTHIGWIGPGRPIIIFPDHLTY